MTAGACGSACSTRFDVDARADLLLHPHAPAARAAAHRLLAVAGRTRAARRARAGAGSRAGPRTRRCGARGSTARGRSRARSAGRRRMRPSVEQARDELRVVHHLVVAAELRVLVLQRVERVRVAGHDAADAELLERRDERCARAAGRASRCRRGARTRRWSPRARPGSRTSRPRPAGRARTRLRSCVPRASKDSADPT